MFGTSYLFFIILADGWNLYYNIGQSKMIDRANLFKIIDICYALIQSAQSTLIIFELPYWLDFKNARIISLTLAAIWNSGFLLFGARTLHSVDGSWL